jgi:hypothetical protein
LTAADLIAALRAVAPETRIVAPGGARGLTTRVAARLVPIVRDPATDPWDGDYSEGGPSSPERAFLIGRAGE